MMRRVAATAAARSGAARRCQSQHASPAAVQQLSEALVTRWARRRDGEMGIRELKQMMQSAGMAAMSDAELAKVFDAIDTDGSGALSAEELTEFGLGTLNQHCVAAEYAVRGAIVARAAEIDKEIASGQGPPRSYKKTLPCNIGNPQAVGQAAPGAIREVLGCVLAPSLLGHTRGQLDAGVAARAEEILGHCGGSVGAYTASRGYDWVLGDVAEFLEKRDGHAADPRSVFTSDGASCGIKLVMNLVLRGSRDACLCPIPQYPLYSATLSVLGAHLAGYYLDEEKNWALSVDELERAMKESPVPPRMLVVINPGNPTGAVLSEENIRGVVAFAARHNLVLMADEVYQENVYAEGARFVSFRKVVLDSGLRVPLASFHSTSKGLIGECGARGGFYQLENFPADVAGQVEKLQSIGLCPNVPAQILTSLMVRPPVSQAHDDHVSGIYGSLKRRAHMLHSALNGIDGVSCQPIQGSMYAFPNITDVISASSKVAAKEAGVPPDSLFCSELLEETGIVTVPGSGFRQVPGTWHLRMTILPQEEDFPGLVDGFGRFVAGFRARYP